MGERQTGTQRQKETETDREETNGDRDSVESNECLQIPKETRETLNPKP